MLTISGTRRAVEHGSWFRGKLYPLRCDVSFDGKHMVYLAILRLGRQYRNGVCRLPWLATLTEAENMGSWFGGGYFASKKLLRAQRLGPEDFNPAKLARAPFTIEPYGSRYGGEDLGVVYERLERDGFRRLGERWGEDQNLGTRKLQVARVGDDGWAAALARGGPH